MKVVLSLFVIFSFFSCNQNVKPGCDSDAQCRLGRICADRICQDSDDQVEEPISPKTPDKCETNADCGQGFACAKDNEEIFSCLPSDLADGTGELRDNDCYFFWEFTVLPNERAKMNCNREGQGQDTYACTCSYITEDETFTGEATLVPEAQSCDFLAAEDFMNHHCGAKFHGSFGVFAQKND